MVAASEGQRYINIERHSFYITLLKWKYEGFIFFFIFEILKKVETKKTQDIRLELFKTLI